MVKVFILYKLNIHHRHYKEGNNYEKIPDYDKIDYYFITTEKMEDYFIPTEDICDKKNHTLNDASQQYRI